MLATYFGALRENLDLAVSLGCDALHVDLVRGEGQLPDMLDRLPEDTILSAGVVDGRNVWKNDFEHSINLLKPAMEKLGQERLMISTSCSLLHCPVDLEHETDLPGELKDWMAFAVPEMRGSHDHSRRVVRRKRRRKVGGKPSIHPTPTYKPLVHKRRSSPKGRFRHSGNASKKSSLSSAKIHPKRAVPTTSVPHDNDRFVSANH